jgi:Xaa-Pro aminopeptidase
LGIDQSRAVLPILVADEQRRPVIVAKEIDRTNLEAIESPTVDFVFHTPYFSFDRAEKPTDAQPSMAAAVAEVASTATELDDTLPVALYSQLTAQLGTSPACRANFHVPSYHYRVPRATVLAQATCGRAEALAAAQPYIAHLPSPERIRDWAARPGEDALRLLDEMMAAANVDTLVASSPLNVQELAGIPALQITPGTFAVYTRETQDVDVFSRRELSWLGLPESSPARAGSLRQLADGGCLGYEELDLPQRTFDGYALRDVPTQPASTLLRRWRERRCWTDLAYYVMAAQVTRKAIDAAILVAETGMASDNFASELDAYDRYRAVVAAEVAPLPIRVRTYFTHTHAGDRTHIPASASHHRIGRDTSLKIDAGLEMYDERGYLRAVSDVTRSAVGTDQARHFYELLDRALTDGAIAACKPGASGQDIFRAGLDCIEPERSWLVDTGFCPPSDRPLTEIFARDTGHLLGKQEPATCVFEPHVTSAVEAGMIAAAEIQWPYRRYCVGVEDNFLITDDGPVNFTRAVP